MNSRNKHGRLVLPLLIMRLEPHQHPRHSRSLPTLDGLPAPDSNNYSNRPHIRPFEVIL